MHEHAHLAAQRPLSAAPGDQRVTTSASQVAQAAGWR
jgi:hypothetical protein